MKNRRVLTLQSPLLQRMSIFPMCMQQSNKFRVSGWEETIELVSVWDPTLPATPITSCLPVEEPPVEESTGEGTSVEDTTSCRVVTASVASGNYAELGSKTVGRKLISTPIPASNQNPTPIAVPTPNAPATIPNAQPTPEVVPGVKISQPVGIPPAEATISVVP